jgi:hypothetical protein
MNGQSLVLLAVGLFTSLVVTVAAVNHYMLSEHPASIASGLLWRVENAVSNVQDLQADLTSTQFAADGASEPSVRMAVRVLVSPVPTLSIEYSAPESLRGQIVTAENDLLSHYLPNDAVVVVRRWAGIPLAAVGLASLDVSGLRTKLQQGTVTARVLDETASLSAATLSTTLGVTSTLTGTSSVSSSDPLSGSYLIEVRDAQSNDLTEALWIDRRTYFIQKIVYYEDGRRVREIKVEGTAIDQGLTTDDVLILPRGVTTIRG